MEAPPPRVDDFRPGDGVRRAALALTTDGGAFGGELAALVSEFDCSKTLETGLGGGSSALAIAAVHEQRGRGGHIAIDPYQETVFSSAGVQRLRDAGLLHRVQLIASSSELALPKLLRDGVETDFALIQGGQRFEDMFMEFLYLDHLLVNEGLMAFAEAGQPAVAAVLEFVAQTRAYERWSPAGSELVVLRKLGRQPPQLTPFPSGWGRKEHPEDDANQRSENGLGPRHAADGQHPALVHGTKLPSSSRELHLAWARASELEVRVAELGACLLDAEQRAAELLRARARLRELELQFAQAEHWLLEAKSSASWRLTAPLRFVKRRTRALRGR